MTKGWMSAIPAVQLDPHTAFLPQEAGDWEPALV